LRCPQGPAWGALAGGVRGHHRPVPVHLGDKQRFRRPAAGQRRRRDEGSAGRLSGRYLPATSAAAPSCWRDSFQVHMTWVMLDGLKVSMASMSSGVSSSGTLLRLADWTVISASVSSLIDRTVTSSTLRPLTTMPCPLSKQVSDWPITAAIAWPSA